MPWELAGGPAVWVDGADDVPEAVVDVSTPGAVVPETQPGVLDATGGLRGHRIRIRFEGAGQAARLELVATAERGPVPDLVVAVDGRSGLLHPRVHRVDRSETGEPGPIAGLVRVGIDLPADWLASGERELTITTALDRAAALGEGGGRDHEAALVPGEELPPARAHYGSWFGSYLRWHRIALVPAAPSSDPEPELRGTPFAFRGHGKEELRLLELVLHRRAGAPAPAASLLADDGPVAVPAWPADRAHGELRIRVPVSAGAVRARLEVDGRVVETTLAPLRRWTLHLVPHVHLDLGFTDVQGSVLELHCRNIDRALDRIAMDPDFRFQVDGAVVAEEYARTRSPEQVARMREAVADGRLAVNALHSNPLTGLMSLPELLHATDAGLALPEPATGRVANLTDVPTASRSLVPVLAERGVAGFVGMANHGRAATDDSDALHLTSPVRWRGADGSELLAFVADHYSQLRFAVADPQSVAGGVDGLGRLLARYDRPDYLPSDLPVIGTHADNEDLGDGDTGFVERWNATFLWPRMRVSSFGEYLAAVAPLRDRLPVWDRELGTYWEDGAGSATAAFARYRRAQALLPAAETLSELVTARSAGLAPPRETFARGWADLLVGAEHTITWARSTSHPHGAQVADQLDWTTRHIDDTRRIALDESRRALAQLAEQEGLTGPGVLVYNPHPWVRDLPVEVELAAGIELADAEGPVSVEVLEDCAGLRRCRFVARDLPAHGWRYLPASAARLTVPGGEQGGADDHDPVEHDSAETPAASIPQARAVRIESEAWLVELDGDGGLPRRIRHRASGAELLDPEAGVGLGALVRAGATAWSAEESDALEHPTRVHGHRRARSRSIENFRWIPDPPRDELVLERPDLRLSETLETPGGVRMRWTGGGASLDRLEVDLLLEDAGHGELSVRFDKRAVLDMEEVYVAFPFAGAPETLRHDRPLGWVRPASDHGPGASNDWLTATNVVAVSAADHEVWWSPRDAALFTVGDVVRGLWPRDFAPHSATIWSYALNNAWPCNVPPAQSGPIELAYSFAIAPSGTPDAAASRFGRAARQPALAVDVQPLDRFGSPPSRARQRSLGLAADPDTTLEIQGDIILVSDLGGADRAVEMEGAPHPLRAGGFAEIPRAPSASAPFRR